MVFREGDDILIEINGVHLKINLENRLRLERIILDDDLKDAYKYLSEIVYPIIKEKFSRGNKLDDNGSLNSIIKQQDFSNSLKYCREIVYRKVLEYMGRPACKPVFELLLRDSTR